MKVKEVIKTIQTSSKFKEWYKNHKKDYLVHVFKMVDEANKDIWQIGYYNKESDKITTFVLEKNNISIVPEAEIFREEKHIIKELDIKKVKIDFQDALEKALKLQNKEYQSEKSLKTIMILQYLEDCQIWNITFVTISFKTLNVKIDAETGKIKSHDLKSLIDVKS